MRSKGLLLASQWLLLWGTLGSRPTDSDAAILGAPGLVPSYLEDTFPGSAPSTVQQIWESLEKQKDELTAIGANGLFSLTPATKGAWRFEYDLKDEGAPYKLTLLPDPEAPILRSATTSLEFKPAGNIAKVKLEARYFLDLPKLKQFDTYLEQGINYAGRITVSGGVSYGERYILVPGTKTYDIGGMTKDPHASERIGPACSKVIMAITTAVVAAMRATARPFFVRGLFASNHELIEDLHNRWTLATYMWDQAYSAFTGRGRVTYAQYVKRFLPALQQQPCFNELQKSKPLLSCHDHTRSYMDMKDPKSPPQEFYAKICEDIKQLEKKKKDDLWKAAMDPEVCSARGL